MNKDELYKHYNNVIKNILNEEELSEDDKVQKITEYMIDNIIKNMQKQYDEAWLIGNSYGQSETVRTMRYKQ